MKTILIEVPGKVVIKEQEKPIRKPGEVLLKILYGGICGSDLGTYRGTFAYASYPRVPGHEFSGEIVEIDENDRGLKPGMIVTVNPYFNDGTCYSCQRGLLNCCEHNETMGAQRDGAFSEYVSVPIERVYDGKGLPAKTLALIEPFCISWHGVSRANVKEGDTGIWRRRWLEFGHALRKGGRTRAFPHIAPAEERAAQTLEREVEKALR